jgi:uncharacterized protein (TIGR02172 family)
MTSLRPGPLLAKGLTSEVYAWDQDRILKLSHTWRPREKTEREFQITRAINAAGLPAPAAHELIEHNHRLGIIFDRIEGISMFRRVQSKPWTLLAESRKLAEIHAHLHTFTAPAELPPQRAQIQGWINAADDLTPAQLSEARACLAKIPDGDTLCHGDFHPENILHTSRGPIIIDWSTATRGHALLDVARTSSLLRDVEIPPGTVPHMRAIIHCFRKVVNAIYLKRYFQLRPPVADLAVYEPLQQAAHSAWRTHRIN